MLGGTYEKGFGEVATDEAALARIVERGRTLLREMGHPRWNELARTRLAIWAGPRPARVLGSENAAIRVGLERTPDGRSIVHDYGHAGLGVTLSWGTAADVVSLVESA